MRPRFRLLRAKAVLLAAAFAAASAAAAPPSAIENFFRVDEKVCTGGQPNAEQLAELKKEGVRTVVNLRQADEYDAAAEETEARAAGLGYISVPFDGRHPDDESVAHFLRALDDPNVYPIFIHCGSGNRVGALWMIHRMIEDGWSADQAEREARQIGLRSDALRDFALDYVKRHPRTAGS
jgi:uncharacterized protein (TIGR01244 family)